MNHGYMVSRRVRGNFTPHHVQGLVIRDYARKRGLTIGLSLTEHAMEGSYMLLREAVWGLKHGDALVLFSLYALPEDELDRHEIYRTVFLRDADIHAALEDSVIRDFHDAMKWEDLLTLENTVWHE